MAYTLPSVGEVRNRISSEYLKHKEFLFNLKNASRSPRRSADENSVGQILEEMKLRPLSIYRSVSGVEVKLKNVHWKQVPDLILRLEKSFTIVSFSAVDNTGKGVFEVRMVLR